MKKDFLSFRIGPQGIEGEGGEIRGRIPASAEVWSGTGIELLEPASLVARASRTADGGLHVTGRLTFRARLACRRCLREMSPTLDVALDLWFDPSVPEEEVEGPVYRVERGASELDLAGPLREEALLALPEYPVCGEGCRGLCPHCGADWNEGPCECRGDDVDPRWNRLRRLMAEEQD
ncbi:MAG: DUF177 domain-containing protein [Gemmatimonadota bacterium]